ncbi:hypothetical protein [Cytobacillus oceanisediminis]|uniref:hypothetical protein n=1 Tax=Cytobacillus oceanisediminis TaxID=665099 RepID=UPI0014170999|nr:hypothetical protein [Cytobacillus oceanisediminis]
MWKRLPHGRQAYGRALQECPFILKGIGFCHESLGAAAKQACDLERAGAGPGAGE